LLRAVRKGIQVSLYSPQWFIAYGPKKGDSLELGDALTGFKKLFPPKDREWADPFIVEVGNSYFIFIEEFLFQSGNSHISVIEIDCNGDYKGITGPVLETGYHVSYPFVFKYEHDFYMIPETSTNHTIEVYRSTSFPNRWEPHCVLMRDVRAADTTLLEFDGRWWMFTALGNQRTDNHTELFLFYSDSPFGPWRPHKKNPVVSDVRRARPAGRIFKRNDSLYRPAQDCSFAYGYAISINRIVTLTEDEYCEEEAERIAPDWSANLCGTHTLNFDGEMMVVDGRRLRMNLSRVK
jgi:hypothetical protein